MLSEKMCAVRRGYTWQKFVARQIMHSVRGGANRATTAPSLVPIFSSTTPASMDSPEEALHLWADCTMRELCELVWGGAAASLGLQNVPALGVSLIYPDRRGQPAVRRLGCVARLRRGPEDDLALEASGWQPGDAIVVAAEPLPQPPPQPGRPPPAGRPQNATGAATFGARAAQDAVPRAS